MGMVCTIVLVAEEVHGKIFDLIDGPDQKVAIAAPRLKVYTKVRQG